MIAKIPKPGKSFKGCVEYNVLKKDAAILEALDVRIYNAAHMVKDFNLQRKMNPALGQAVGHISLSWSTNDLPKLSDEVMLNIAHEYLERMKINNTQLLIVRHFDKDHPHLHIIYNRVDNSGKTIPDNFQHTRSAKICRALTIQHGFYIAMGKDEVKRQQLKGADKVKYEIYDAIKAESKSIKSLNELKSKLATKGITTIYKYKNGSKDIQGVSFSKGEYTFKGSEIDRGMSYGNLLKTIDDNIQRQEEARKGSMKFADEVRQAIKDHESQHSAKEQPGSSEPNKSIAPEPDTGMLNEYYPLPGIDISIADDVDDEAIHGRNRRRKQQARTNTR